MIIILIRSLLLYVFALIGMRVMGKGEFSEMQPFEVVIILMIAELAALPMEDVGVPLVNGFVAISTLVFVQILISYINLKSQKARGLICGKPSVLINKGLINEKELKRLRININDLVEQLRIKEYPIIDDVDFAILETNGDLSVIPKPNKRPVTVEDIHKQPYYEGLPVSVIIDGYVNYDNLHKLNLTKSWLDHTLKEHEINDEKNVLFAYIDKNKQIYIHRKN